MSSETRDLRLSVDQLYALINLLGPLDQINTDPAVSDELRDMLLDALNTDPGVLNDFTA